MRLLLAEDEKELANALSVILQHNQYSVDVVHNGKDALDYLDTDLYDAAVLDIMMPIMDGLTVVKELRKRGSNLPVLLLTAKSEIDDRVNGLDAGADDYLTKPFATKELLARIRAITRRGQDTTDTSLTFQNITLNRSTYILSSPTGEFRLGNKEYQMLEMLMVRPGQVIPTERFMEKIWGYDSEAELNVVWVYLSYLRKKLTALDAKVQIKVARNLGYSLEAQND